MCSKCEAINKACQRLLRDSREGEWWILVHEPEALTLHTQIRGTFHAARTEAQRISNILGCASEVIEASTIESVGVNDAQQEG
jgi:hypothetical protein